MPGPSAGSRCHVAARTKEVWWIEISTGDPHCPPAGGPRTDMILGQWKNSEPTSGNFGVIAPKVGPDPLSRLWAPVPLAPQGCSQIVL